MNATSPDAASQRILLFLTDADESRTLQAILAGTGHECHCCETMDAMCLELPRGAGAVIVGMEKLDPPGMKRLIEQLQQQENWSDLPLIVLCQMAEESNVASIRMLKLLEPLGQFAILQRPVTTLGLVSAVEAALRARNSQYRVRDGMVRWEQMLQQREQFLNLLAHEVRNPLNALRSASQILGRVDPLTSSAIEQQSLIERQTARLAHLIDEVLSVFELQTRRVRMRMDPVDLVAVASRVVAGVANESAAKRLRIRFEKPDQPLVILGDPERLHLVFTDLLTHAVRSSPAESEIQLDLRRTDDRAVVRLRDENVSITEADIERLFLPLTELDAAPDRSTEAGLPFGLSLVEGLVKLHNGAVSANPVNESTGCEVHLQFPLAPESSSDSAPVSRAERPSRRIVVVEDNADGRESLKVLLELWGHEVKTAMTGQEGLQWIRSEAPDVALVDIGLPGMTGYQIARELRKTGNTSTHLIAMTGYGQPHDRRSAFEAGFDSFLVKPIDAANLHEMLESTPAHAVAKS